MNEFLKQKLEQQKARVERIFKEKKRVFCPYFGQDVVLNSDGFYHLRYSDRRERTKEEQLLKLNLFPLAVKIIESSGTLQEYRTGLLRIGKKSSKNGLSATKQVEYWGFVAIHRRSDRPDKDIKIRVILRRVGNGNIIFWSVMPYGDIKNLRLYTKGIEDD